MRYSGTCFRAFLGFFCIILFSLEQITIDVFAFSKRHVRFSESNKIIAVSPAHHTTNHSHYFPHSSFRTRLPVLSNGQAALPSGAFDFHGPWNASVDPRTGNAGFSLKVASLLYDNGHAQRDLLLSYSGAPVPGGPDPFDLGPHWRWNVGTERPSATEVAGHKTTDIVTGDGHAFTMVSDRNARGETRWHPLRHKLADVVITGHPGNWTLSMATGVREHIVNGFETEEQSHDGHHLYFYYDRHGALDATRHLIAICARRIPDRNLTKFHPACTGPGIRITRQGHTVTIHGRQKITLYRQRTGGVAGINRIIMPSLDSEELAHHRGRATIALSYDTPGNRPWLLREVRWPAGMRTRFLYNNESRPSANPAGLPVGIHGAGLPVVTEAITESGSPQVPARHLYYRYGTGPNHAHNYTGYQGRGSVLPGRDNLLDRTDDYTYRVTVDNGHTSTTTTYNKYHLPLTIVQRDDRHHMPQVTRLETYPPWKHTVFAQLSANYSQAIASKQVIRTLTETGTGPGLSPIRMTQQSRYDQYGRILWQRDATGRQVFTRYCPPKGDRHCPPADAGWPIASRPEKLLMVPAPESGKELFPKAMEKQASPPSVEVIFDYARLPVTGKGNHGLHFWQVTKRTTATLEPSQVAKLAFDAPLPEPLPEQVVTRSRYTYHTEIKSPFYGELSGLTLIRSQEPLPVIHGRMLLQTKMAVPPLADTRLAFRVTHAVNSVAGTRSTTFDVVRNAKDHARTNVAMAEDGITLGTRVYSLATGQKVATNDPLGVMKTEWRYDRWDRPVSETVIPARGYAPRTTHWTWLSGHGEEALVTTDPIGNQQKTVYAPSGEVLSTWHRFHGTVQWIPDSRTGYTAMGRTALHTVYHAADPIGLRPGKRIALTTTYGYDALNRPVWMRKPGGMIQLVVRDDAALREIHYAVVVGEKDRQIRFVPQMTVIQANIAGKPVAQYQLALEPGAQKRGKTLYGKNLARMLATLKASVAPAVALQATDSTGLLPLAGENSLLAFVRKVIEEKAWLTRTTMAYDGAGHRIRQTQGNGAVTRWHWQRGEPVAVTAPDGRVVHDRWNTAGQRIARCVQPAGSNACHTLGTRGYDSTGNLLWQADEYGHLVRYRYDGDGRMTDRYTPDGHHFHWKYCAPGMTRADVDGTPYLSITYDPVTWQITDREDRVSHLHYTYDPQTGAPVRITRSAPQHLTPIAGMAYPGGTETVTFDRYLAPIAAIDMHGNRFTTRHDALGRTIRTEVRLSGSTTTQTLISITYDSLGRVATMTNGIGLTRTFIYNPEGAPESATDRLKGETVLTQKYEHDPDTGNLLAYTRSENGETATQTYHYDINNNLTDMTCTPSSLCPRDTAIAGSTLQKPPVIVAQHYRFDGWNNIVRAEEELQDSHDNRLTKTTRYTYAQKKPQSDIPEAYDPHRLLGMSTQWSNTRFSTPAQEIVYDSMGRIIRDTEGDPLHYNAFGQQDRFVNARTGQVTHYTYDSNGHQIAEQPFDEKGHALQAPLYLFYSGNAITSQSQADSSGKIHMSTELAGVARSEDKKITRWYLHDYKGDVLNSFDGHGQKVQDSLYSPYGMAFDRMGALTQVLPVLSPLDGKTLLWQRHRPGFDGQMSDPATGYQFLGGGYRAYNPVYRHFMARDSFSPFTKIDGYGFGDNNPVMNTDPTGHLPVWLGYTMGLAGIGMSIGLCALLPLATAISAGTVITSGAIAIGMAFGSLGTVSGSLQIAATAFPGNKTLAISSDAFALAGGVAALGMGGVTAAAGIIPLIADMKSMTLKMVTASAISGAVSGLFSTPSAGMGVALAANPGLSHKSGYVTAMGVLDGLSSALMMASIFAGSYANWVLMRRRFFSSSYARACFTGTTQVVMSSGKTLPIDEIRPGMRVMEPEGGSRLAKEKENIPMAVVTFTGSRRFISHHHTVASCTKETDRIGNTFLRCPILIRLLRPLSKIRQWQSEQQKNGNVRLAFSSQGMQDVRVKIARVEPFAKADANHEGKQVTGTFMQYAEEVRTYHFRNLATNHLFTIEATPNHPFYSESRNGYIPVSQLDIHDKLVNRHGQQITLLCPVGKTTGCGSPLHKNTPTPVYNLEVKGLHHYLINDEGMLVHNMCPLERYLKRVAPDLLETGENRKAYLKINNSEDITKAWDLIEDFNKKKIHCDTVCALLTSQLEKKPLEIGKLATLLTESGKADRTMTYPAEHPYPKAIKEVFSTFGEMDTLNEGTSLELGVLMDAPGKKMVVMNRQVHPILYERFADFMGHPVFGKHIIFENNTHSGISLEMFGNFYGKPFHITATKGSLSYIKL